MANYFYNGIELPALPEWDKEKYPCAFIYYYDDSIVVASHVIILSPTPIVAYVSSFPWVTPSTYGFKNDSENFNYFICNVDENEWRGLFEHDGRFYKPDIKSIWANHDVLIENTTDIYLPASDPVPVPDEPESVLAWQKHDAYKPNAKWDGNTFYRVMGGKWVKQDAMNPSFVEVEPAGDPIAYLYNDVQLPDINGVWTDKVTYPYAMITRTITDGTCLLHVCGDMPYYTEQSHSTEGYEPTVIAPKPCKAFAHVDGSWVLNIEQTDQGLSNRTESFEFIWTNVDVMNKDNGSVYFDASEPPVPVYA